MLNSGRISCAATLLLFAASAPCAQAHASEEFLIGAWARSQPECARPELTFSKTRLDIVIDADGQATSFAFPAIRYQLLSEQIAVSLGRRHPYSKTQDKQALLFNTVNHDTIALRKTKGGNTQFIRCSRV